MAKVTGPLMSMEASGTVGDALTFSRWVGRPYVRRYTVPSNPQTLGQETHRNRFSAIGTITTWSWLLGFAGMTRCRSIVLPAFG